MFTKNVEAAARPVEWGMARPGGLVCCARPATAKAMVQADATLAGGCAC